MKPKIALAIIVKGSDDEADILSRCLNYTTPLVDGVFITITQENKKIEDVAKLFKANISHYKWDYNFANARNFNFSQVPKDYTHILWMDTDDLFKNLENLRKIIKENPDVDAFSMNYLYWFDDQNNPTVVHIKTQVIKNDGCVEWAGALHEDFKENRELNIQFIKGISRLHLSTEKRVETAKKRNLEISENCVRENPLDPRSWWNLGNSEKGIGYNDRAVKTFGKFIEMSKSDDEKYYAQMAIAEIYLDLKDCVKSINAIRYAIGLKPEFPDAYHLAGHIYFEMNDFKRAKESFMSGLKKKPPIYQIIVYNPRNYDYIPLKMLAKVYFNLNLPNLAIDCLKACLEIMPDDQYSKDMIKNLTEKAKMTDDIIKKIEQIRKIKDKDKMKKEIDNLPIEYQQHPAICNLRNINFIKTESSGKDVVFMCAYTQEEWTPEILKAKGIGGSEEAIINLSRELAKKGWNVTVYNNCGHKELEFDGVKYKPFWSWNYRDRQDIVVLWRHPKMTDYAINAKKIYIDMHDVLPTGEFNESRMKRITKILVKSKAHRDLYPHIKDNKFAIIPNGVDLSFFNKEVKRDPYYIINLSSADRSLNTILDIIPDIMKKLPNDIAKKVKFGWFYGWKVFDISATSEQEQSWKQDVLKKFDKFKKQGLIIGGDRINHDQVAEENLKAGALLYPTEFYEIDYVGGTKAQIAGCIPITTNFAALDEKIQYGIKVPVIKTIENWSKDIVCDFGVKDKKTKEMFVEAVVYYLINVYNYEKEREKMSKWAREKYDISNIADIWDEEFKQGKLNIYIPK